MTQLFALVLTICSGNNNCADVVKGVYDTQAQCERVIYEERYFNANCYPVDGILHLADVDILTN